MEGAILAVAVAFVASKVEVIYEGILGAIEVEAAAEVLRSYGAVVLISSAALLWSRSGDRLAILSRLELRPVQTVVLSFGLAVVTGTLLLSLPVSVTSTDRVSVFDSFFMATSAVCVTGLSVVDLGATYSRFGQVVILFLIQAGGLGIMALFAAFALIAGRRLSAKNEQELGEAVGAGQAVGMRRSLRFIVAFTFGFELIGILLLLPGLLRLHPEDGVFLSIFHAVSAFTNAGFAVMPGGVQTMGPGALAILSCLVVIGGLGAPVLGPIALLVRRRRKGLGLHAKLALWTTAALLVVGFSGILLFESSHSRAGASFLERIGNAAFLSVIARTAGFDVVGAEALSPAGAVWMMLLMLIGASPGSTGGGLKTTTFAVLFLSLVAVLGRRRDVTAFRRTVPQEDVLRAIALVWSGLSILAAGILLLLATQDLPPFALLFEAFSAFSTTGMSLGVTGELSASGRLIVMALMFVGRLGPLALLAAFFDRRDKGRISYPTQHVEFG